MDLPSPIIESPPDGPFILDSSFTAPDLSLLITPSLLDEFESHSKRSLPSTTFSDNLQSIQSFSQSACTSVTNHNAPYFSTSVPSSSAFIPMHANTGDLAQAPSAEPIRNAGAVIIPPNLLKGGIVQQPVVGQANFKTEPLSNGFVASSAVKSENPLSLHQLLNSSNELQFLSNTKGKKQSLNSDPINSTDRVIPLLSSSIPSFSSPNISQAAVSSPIGLVPMANSSFAHTHSSAQSFESDLGSIPLFRMQLYN